MYLLHEGSVKLPSRIWPVMFCSGFVVNMSSSAVHVCAWSSCISCDLKWHSESLQKQGQKNPSTFALIHIRIDSHSHPFTFTLIHVFYLAGMHPIPLHRLRAVEVAIDTSFLRSGRKETELRYDEITDLMCESWYRS
jgi:hypothetical protein